MEIDIEDTLWKNMQWWQLKRNIFNKQLDNRIFFINFVILLSFTFTL